MSQKHTQSAHLINKTIIATVFENGLWVCTVWQAFDEDLNVYFFGANNRRRSKEQL